MLFRSGDKPASARLVVPPGTTLRDALTDAVLHAEDGAALVPMPARDVRFLVVRSP